MSRHYNKALKVYMSSISIAYTKQSSTDSITLQLIYGDIHHHQGNSQRTRLRTNYHQPSGNFKGTATTFTIITQFWSSVCGDQYSLLFLWILELTNYLKEHYLLLIHASYFISCSLHFNFVQHYVYH